MVIPSPDPSVAFRLDGKVAVVTGASRGIGLAIAEGFARAGAAGVVLNARKPDGLAEAAARVAIHGADVVTVAGSIADPATVSGLIATAADRFGGIDVIVNNAAANPAFAPLVDTEPKAVRKILAVNLEGPLALIRAAWHASLAERGGAVINIASIGGLQPAPFTGAYNTSKAALVHLTRQLALECAPHVRVNAIAPGLVRTRFARVLWEPDEEAAQRGIPLGRIGEPIDVAHAALFLASGASAWMTGSVLVLDGGQLLAI